jgi:aerobic carbon-monoxide dehydrogenase medium subunit
MKPAPFEYVRPKTLEEALALLAAHDDAKPIAGGQSLVPLLALRMASPSLLVDIAHLDELSGVSIDDESIRIGALTRWREVLESTILAEAHPLLVEAISHTAHYQIRNRGTVGGGCCHADPSAEMPAVAMTCDAEFEIASARGTRTLQSQEFFVDILTTALEPDELLVSVRLPIWRKGRRYAFEELSRRKGDFAVAGCVLFWDDEGDANCKNPHVGVFGVASTPLRVSSVEAALAGKQIDWPLISEAVSAMRKAISPQSDLHATSAYRSAVLEVLLERALLRASCLSEARPS